VVYDTSEGGFHTAFADGNNLLVRTVTIRVNNAGGLTTAQAAGAVEILLTGLQMNLNGRFCRDDNVGLLFHTESLLFITAPAVRAEPLHNDPVAADPVSGFFLDLQIDFVSIVHGNINHRAAFHADHVIMPVGSAVVPIGTGDTHMAYYPILRQTVEISVYRSPTDSAVDRIYVFIDLLGTRMVMVRLHGVPNNSPLSGFSSLLHFWRRSPLETSAYQKIARKSMRK
jgi:hypothetical protein